MIKVLMRNPACKRWISFTASRLCQKADNALVDPTLVSNEIDTPAVSLPKLVEDLPPPVHNKPFEELDLNKDAKEKHSDFGQYVEHLAPPLPVSFNLAAYVNQSESLQNLVRLGVDLSVLESKKPAAAKFILTLDFEKDIKSHLQFLHDHGVQAEYLGKFITKNPFIFKESIENLEVRVNYLKSKLFSDVAIARILTLNPFFLSTTTLNVDSRLGFFQKQFSLQGDEVRYLITKYPKLVTHNFQKLTEMMFTIKEEIGLDRTERKELLLKTPKVYTLGRYSLIERFNIMHNIMKLPHEIIMKCPEAFQTRGFILKQRHLYLEHLGLAQYDSSQPLYISLHDIALLNDSEFCAKCAKTSVEKFNDFLRKL